MASFYLNSNERLDDLEYNNLKIIQDKSLYCFSSDAVLLANHVRATKTDCVVDFGTGSGVIAILIAAKTTAPKVIGVEVQKVMAELAERNVILNNLQDRVKIINEDIKNIVDTLGNESVKVVVCNPPYFKKEAGEVASKSEIAISRSEILCSLEDIIINASKILKYGGKFYMIHKSERMAEVITLLKNNNLEPKVLTLIYPKKSKQVDTFIIESHKNGSPGLKIKDLIVYDENNEMTKEAKKLYSKD